MKTIKLGNGAVVVGSGVHEGVYFQEFLTDGKMRIKELMQAGIK